MPDICLNTQLKTLYIDVNIVELKTLYIDVNIVEKYKTQLRYVGSKSKGEKYFL